MGASTKELVHSASAALAETIWPTRCVVCGQAGAVVCETCLGELPFIDQWKACQQCGAPYGRHQCTECNTYALRSMGLKKAPFSQCVSAVHFTDSVAHIVRARKDANERRLDSLVSFYMASAIPPEWLKENPVVSSIPATTKALRKRGFDHGSALARSCAEILGLSCRQTLIGTRRRDQRLLDREARFSNMLGSFSALGVQVPPAVLIVDDVYTTGATLMAATHALRQQGVVRVYCATFAHVYRN